MSSGKIYTIVPVKALGRAKRRLSDVLPDLARQQLVVTMLEDVLATLAEAAGIDCVVVVTPDARVAAVARGHGATIVPEPEPETEELNAAIAGGLAYATARSATQAMVLPADVPLATAAELRSLIQSRGEQPGVTLAPSHDGNGTNGLLLAPPGAITPCYGSGSYLQHMSQAMARRIDVNVVHLEGLSRDIDEPADLALLLARRQAGSRYAFLAPYVAGSARLQSNPQGNDQ